MAEIVNLRQMRKRKVREEQDVQAANNRARFGRTKAERDAAAMTEARAERQLDGHKREPDDGAR